MQALVKFSEEDFGGLVDSRKRVTISHVSSCLRCRILEPNCSVPEPRSQVALHRNCLRAWFKCRSTVYWHERHADRRPAPGMCHPWCIHVCGTNNACGFGANVRISYADRVRWPCCAFGRRRRRRVRRLRMFSGGERVSRPTDRPASAAVACANDVSLGDLQISTGFSTRHNDCII